MSEERARFTPSTMLGDSSMLSTSTSDTSESYESTPRTSQRGKVVKNFLSWKARVPFKSLNIGKSLSKLTPSRNSPQQEERIAVCSYCPLRLEKLVPAFRAAGMHGIYLHNRHLSHSTPKTSRRQHRNYKQENEWLLQNVFDSQGNYVFCYSCILAWLEIYQGRLTKLRKVKWEQNTTPLRMMTKKDVEKEGLFNSVVLPEDTTVSLKEWWQHLATEHLVTVRYPYGHHGLKNKPSNRQDKQIVKVIIYMLNSSQYSVVYIVVII